MGTAMAIVLNLRCLLVHLCHEQLVAISAPSVEYLEVEKELGLWLQTRGDKAQATQPSLMRLLSLGISGL
jgi:hypothetical protein